MGLRYPVRLQSIENYVAQVHGSARQLTYDEALLLDEYASQIVGAIQEAWPVDTGLSQASWEWEIGTEAGDYYILILNEVPYVQYIHRAGAPASPALWEVLIPAVISAFGGRLVRDLRAEIDRTEAALRVRPGSFLDMIQQTRSELGL